MTHAACNTLNRLSTALSLLAGKLEKADAGDPEAQGKMKSMLTGVPADGDVLSVVVHSDDIEPGKNGDLRTLSGTVSIGGKSCKFSFPSMGGLQVW